MIQIEQNQLYILYNKLQIVWILKLNDFSQYSSVTEVSKFP